MFTQVTETIFRDAFQAIRPDNFTRAGLVALFDHLENYDDYDSFLFSNGIESENFEKLQEYTTVILFGESSFIIQAF